MFTPDILHVIMGSGTGGASTQLVELTGRLLRRGWRVYVACLLPPGGVIAHLPERGVPVFSLGMKRGHFDPRSIVRLISIIRRVDPTIIHSHGVHANLLTRVCRIVARRPVLVCTAHSIQEGGRNRELAYRLTDFLCDITTQVSRAGRERYIRVGAVPAARLRFIPNGVDTVRFRPKPYVRNRVRQELQLAEDAFVWLAVGRFEDAKDYPNLLNAFALVAAATSNAVLLLVGDGRKLCEVQRLARELRVAHLIRFLGVRRDIPDLMATVDAYVLSSAWEGLPMVLLEASACALPIVTTDVGGTGEVVRDGETGFVVPPKNPRELAQAMLRITHMTHEERNRMGQAGRNYIVSNYDLDHVVDRWETLYFELLRERRGI